MSDKQERPPAVRDHAWPVVRGRRRLLASLGGVAGTILAGCASSSPQPDGSSPVDGDSDSGQDDGSPAGEDDAEASTGRFRLLISDRPADISDFETLDVTLHQARIFAAVADSAEDDGSESGDESAADTDQAANATAADETATPDRSESNSTDTDEVNGSTGDGTEESMGSGESSRDRGAGERALAHSGDDADAEGEFTIISLEDVTVDLTEVVGEKAISVFDGRLEAGRYAKIELHVSNVAATTVDGETATVKVPSEKLQITHPFEIEPDAPLDFVFDINVVQRGQENRYNLTPVISESGVAGEDVDVEEVDNEAPTPDADGDDESVAPEDDADPSENESATD